MASHDSGGFRLNVLNPGGRDPEQHFIANATTDGAAHEKFRRDPAQRFPKFPEEPLIAAELR